MMTVKDRREPFQTAYTIAVIQCIMVFPLIRRSIFYKICAQRLEDNVGSSVSSHELILVVCTSKISIATSTIKNFG